MCQFNECSCALFDIPEDLQKYFGEYDGGNPNDVVKKFIHDSRNLKKGGALRSYCTNLQKDSRDFTAYCYDYNDVSSSPWLIPPYKIKVTYTDL